MIRVRIYGCKDLILRARFRRCVFFYLSRLLPKQKNILIRIFFSDSLHEDHDMIGSCLVDDHPSNRRHKKFTIHLDTSLNFIQMLVTLAHELIHVKQYATMQLSYDYKNSENTIWNKNVYGPEAFSYKECPWEIEAKKFEKILSRELLKNKTVWE